MVEHTRISQIHSMAECNEFQYLLLGDVRDILDETPDESNRQWLLAVLDVLVSLMPRERHLHDQRGGYMSEVLEVFPGWSRKVMQLHLKKLQLDYSLRECRDHIRREKSWVSIADQLSCELRDWMRIFKEIHQAESALLMDAMLLNTSHRD